jgi:tetratricopeptide (TPR) repeat protein
VAYHYGQTGEHAKAALWLERAGDSARAEFANAAALGHYAAARQHLEACGAEAAQLPGLDEKLGEARLLLGAYVQAQEDFARARAQATDTVRRAELARKEADAWQRQGELVHALAALDAAEAAGSTTDGCPGLPPGVRAAIEVLRGEVHCLGGAYREAAAAVGRALAGALHLQGRIALDQGAYMQAEDCQRRSLALRERLGDQPGIAECWFDLGRPFFEQGDTAQAEECWRRSLTLYERLSDPQGAAYCWLSLGGLAARQGDLDNAEDGFRRLLSSAERTGDQQGLADAWTSLGELAFARGDYAQAEDYYRRGLSLSERCGYHWGVAGVGVFIGHVARARGELAGAGELYRRSLEMFEAMGTRGDLVIGWYYLGEVACERGDLSAAVWWYRQARRLASTLGRRAGEAYCLLGHARARLRAGRLRAAAVLLEHGRAMVTAINWIELTLQMMLVTCELRLRQGTLAEARAAAEEALQLATDGGRRADEAVARRLLGQCALAMGRPGDAEVHLRRALERQMELDAALEAARTRLVLTEALVAASGTATSVCAEAWTLTAEAQAQFAASGAALDLAAAARMVAAWEVRTDPQRASRHVRNSLRTNTRQ